jgi:hypothetical protein
LRTESITAQNNLQGAPTGVILEEFLEGDAFAVALGIRRIIWAEGFVNCVQEDAMNAIGAGRTALGECNEVINIDI